MNLVRHAALAAASALLAVAASASATEIDNTVLADEADGTHWPGTGRTFSEQHFSPLDEINKSTIGRLGLAWSLDLDTWQVSTMPVEVDGVLYFAAGFSVVHAVDVATGKLLWTYDPKIDPKKMRMAWGSRGITYWKGKLYAGVQDGRLFAVDAKTGQLVWEVQTGEPGDNRYITGAPRVFNGKVLIGHGGADFGHVRGYVTTYDAETGKQLWRFHLVPGNPADGFENKAMEMAAKTWTGEWWKYGGGGTAWNAMTYDPKYNRVYIGTGNGGPWNRKLRSPGGGDNLFLCSIVALDADTGEYVWHYQTTPGETWDFNSTMDIVLADLEIEGRKRHVLMHAPKNGFFYVIDRDDGKLLSAEKLGKVTWASHVDLKSGRPVEYPGVRYEHDEALIWPGSAGVHNWHPMSFSPDTQLMYIPTKELAGLYDDRGMSPKTYNMAVDGPLGLHAFFDDVPKEAGKSWLVAWNPVTQKEVWRNKTPGVTAGGVLSTRGGLVFQGRADGLLVATDADTGQEVWRYEMGVGTQANPISYRVGGKQYISILAGWSGGQMVLGSLSAQHGWVGREHARRLLTFALDGNAPAPKSAPPKLPAVLQDASFKVDPALAEKGKYVYQACVICHGVAVVAGGYAPDLRASQVPLQADAFKAIVQGGALASRGMPPFSEFTDEQLGQLQHYIRSRAEYEPSFWEKVKAIWHIVVLMVKMELMKRGWIDP